MRFPGQLLLDERQTAGLKVVLELDGETLTLTSGDEVLGSWSLAEVAAERLNDTTFRFVLGDESVRFLTYDPLPLAEEGLPALQPLKGRRRLRKRPPTPAPPAAPEVVEVAVDEHLVVRETAEEPTVPVEPVRSPSQASRESDPRPGLMERVRQSSLADWLRGAPEVPADHRHAYASQRLPGNLVRRVCEECGHVSIDIG